MRGSPADPEDAAVDGLRVGPWVQRPYTGTRRRDRHMAAARPQPVPVYDPADQVTTRALPVDVEPEPDRRRGRWLAVALVAAGLAVAVVVPLVVVRHPGGPTVPAAVPPVPVPASSDGSPAGVPPVPSPSASPSASAGPSASPSPGRSSAAPAPVPPFAPVAIEAEDPRNTIGGSAWIDSYDGASGGQIVRNIGEWNGHSHNQGWLRVPVTVPATRTYLLTVYVVHLDGAPNRDLVVTVDDTAPVTVGSTADDVCCTPVRLRVALNAGSNTIMFGNPDDHAPSIDRIVLSA